MMKIPPDDPLVKRLHKAAGKERAEAAMAAYVKHGSDDGLLTDEAMNGLIKFAEGVQGYEKFKKFFNPGTMQRLTKFEKLGVGIALAEGAARNNANVPVVKKQQATPAGELIKSASGRTLSRAEFNALWPIEQLAFVQGIEFSRCTLSRADFNALSPAKRLAFIKEGGKLI